MLQDYITPQKFRRDKLSDEEVSERLYRRKYHFFRFVQKFITPKPFEKYFFFLILFYKL